MLINDEDYNFELIVKNHHLLLRDDLIKKLLSEITGDINILDEFTSEDYFFTNLNFESSKKLIDMDNQLDNLVCLRVYNCINRKIIDEVYWENKFSNKKDIEK